MTKINKVSDRWLIVIFTGVLAITSILQRCTMERQLSTIKDQFKQMSSAGVQTDKLIQANLSLSSSAKKQVFIAQSTLKSNQRLAQSTLKEMKAQSNAMQLAAESTKTQADTSKNALYATGADLHVKEIVCSDTSSPLVTQSPLNLKTQLIFNIINTGMNAAKNVQIEVHIVSPLTPSMWLGALIPPNGENIYEGGSTVLGAGLTGKSSPLVLAKYYTDEILSQIIGGGSELELKGSATYDDIFRRHHKMEFDYVYIPKTSCSFINKLTR